MKPIWEKVRKYWQTGLIVVLLFAVVFLAGRVSAPKSLPQASDVPSASTCKAEPLKFDKIDVQGLTVTYIYTLPKNFNSGIDYGDGTHSKYKSNVSKGPLEAKDTYTYARPGKYQVGL